MFSPTLVLLYFYNECFKMFPCLNQLIQITWTYYVCIAGDEQNQLVNMVKKKEWRCRKEILEDQDWETLHFHEFTNWIPEKSACRAVFKKAINLFKSYRGMQKGRWWWTFVQRMEMVVVNTFFQKKRRNIGPHVSVDVTGRGGSAARIRFEPPFLCCGDGQTEKV